MASFSLKAVQGQDFRLSPDGKYLAYASGGKNSDIRVLSLREPEQSWVVAGSSAKALNPVWSPDGRYIVFRSNAASTWDLWGLDLHEGQAVSRPFSVKRKIGAEVNLRDWLPDGQLTFARAGRLNDVWLLPVDPRSMTVTDAPRLLGKGRGQNGQPAWSFDPNRVAYKSRRLSDDRRILHVNNVETGEDQAFDLPAGYFQNPTWSPDNKIVVWAYNKEERWFLELDVSSGETRTFLEHPFPNDHRNTPKPDFSPQGTFLFDVVADDPRVAGLYLFDGTRVSKIPGTDSAWGGVWSQDGEWISYIEDNSAMGGSEAVAIWRIRPNGSGKREVFQLPEGHSLNRWAWSPDSRFIVYPRFIGDGSSLWVVSLDGEVHRKLAGTEGLVPWWLDWSPDGRLIVMAAWSGRDEFWVMENFWPKPE